MTNNVASFGVIAHFAIQAITAGFEIVANLPIDV